MTVKDRDDLDHAIVKMRSLFMAIKGADSLMDRDEADALEGAFNHRDSAFSAPAHEGCSMCNFVCRDRAAQRGRLAIRPSCRAKRVATAGEARRQF
jgi:hypothetical protein